MLFAAAVDAVVAAVVGVVVDNGVITVVLLTADQCYCCRWLLVLLPSLAVAAGMATCLVFLLSAGIAAVYATRRGKRDNDSNQSNTISNHQQQRAMNKKDDHD